jgi:hypothetical protein
MALDLLKFMPNALENLDSSGNFSLYLKIFSEVYEEIKSDNELVLTVQDLDRAPSWCLLYIAQSLGAEILRLNEFENPNMDIDSDGNGIADNWLVSGGLVGSIELRRKSLSQKLLADTNGVFYQVLTLGAEPCIIEAKIRVTSGAVRLGDVSSVTKSVEITAGMSNDAYATYSLMLTPYTGARNYGLKVTENGTVAYIDSVRIEKNSKQAMMRVWLRNAVIEYKRKGCKDGLSSIVSMFTGVSVDSYVEQKLDKNALLYNRKGCEYLYFGVNGAPDPAAGIPGNPALYSLEWNSLQTSGDMNTIYMDFGSLVNGSFDKSLDGWTVGAGSGVIGFERPYTGESSLKLTGSSILMYQDNVTITSGQRWVFSAWVWVPSCTTWSFSQMPRIIVRPSGGGSAIVTGAAATTSVLGQWQQIKAVVPNTNSVTSLRVEIQATGTNSSAYIYTDSWWGIKNKWLLVNVNDPGVTKRAEMKDLLEALLLNYVPIGVEVEIAFV